MLRLLAVCCTLYVALAAQAPVVQLNDGNKMPVLALGTGRGTAPPSASVDEVRQAVFWAIEAGYRHIDTAAVYHDEEQVGQGIAEAIDKGLVTREDLFVTTKLGNSDHRQEKVVPALRKSLKELGLAYVDLYLIHFPSAVRDDDSDDDTSEDIDFVETWRGMMEAKKLGLARSIGVSNFNSSQVDRLMCMEIPPAVNEIEVNPTMTQEPLVRHCHNLGVRVMAYSPLGFVVSRGNSKTPPPQADDPVLVALAKKYNKSVPQIVLRYLVDRNLIPIPKSTNKDRIVANIDIFDFSLTEDEINTMNAFNKNIRVIDFHGWEGYPYFPFNHLEE
ncbi:aldo-keto reductase AKR2E4-like [Aricia agestis]|uniref:aldo-keto reductase AKR2E4-like n=1 Tax=Aricia agestis TaxID=91739 RepID=UPI001C2059D9|nr:aldo-keto reductase AKR2E4-like [Aricia agestis]